MIYSSGTLHMDKMSVPIQDVALKTYREQWTIETGGVRGSGRFMLVARHDDDETLNFIKNSFINIITKYLNKHGLP